MGFYAIEIKIWRGGKSQSGAGRKAALRLGRRRVYVCPGGESPRASEKRLALRLRIGRCAAIHANRDRTPIADCESPITAHGISNRHSGD